MARREPNILLVSHDATRTGAPTIALEIARWLKENTRWNLRILLGSGGALLREFEEVADVRVAGNEAAPIEKASRTGQLLQTCKLGMWYPRGSLDLVYSNTITNGFLIGNLVRAGCPVITHVHELETWIHEYWKAGLWDPVRQWSTHYIACSRAVRDNLTRNHGIAAERIETIHSFIRAGEMNCLPATNAPLRASLGIPAGALVIYGSGSPGWIKGTDIFIHLARRIRQKRPELPIHFVWIGYADETELWRMQCDVRRSGLGSVMHLPGGQEKPLDYYAAGDLFVLTSREDSFPLSLLESAALGKALMAFEQSGGAAEFIEQDAGILTPYLDIETMADALIDLAQQPGKRTSLGQRAREKVLAHYDYRDACRKIQDAIERCLDKSSIRKKEAT